MATAPDQRKAAAKTARGAHIQADVNRFFSRYRVTPTADQVVADAKKVKGSIDRFAYQRIIDKAKRGTFTPFLTNAAPRPATKPAARPSPPANGSVYFQAPGTPSAAAAAPGGGIDPLLFALAGLVLFAFLRR
jgi:MYXO-CTERM domain-containing protein